MVAVVIAGLFGLIFGSFLNVVIYRFDDWVSIMKTRSHCRDCKTQLRWYDLVPLVSYITLRGRCRYCQKPISWQYPVVEVITACLFMAGYLLIYSTQNSFPPVTAGFIFGFYILAIGSLITIFFHDLYEMYISDYLSYFFIAAALGFSLLYYGDWQLTLMGAFIITLPIALIVYPSHGKWMGEGDVKLALGLGIFTAYQGAVLTLVMSFLLGGFFGAIALMTKKARLKSAIPFAPFLIIGALISIFYGDKIINWYLSLLGYGVYY